MNAPNIPAYTMHPKMRRRLRSYAIRSAARRWLWRFVRRFRPQPHVWKETKRETLGSYIDYGSSPQEITTIYRIGIHETCLLTGENRIREIGSLHRQDSSPNIRHEPRPTE